MALVLINIETENKDDEADNGSPKEKQPVNMSSPTYYLGAYQITVELLL